MKGNQFDFYSYLSETYQKIELNTLSKGNACFVHLSLKHRKPEKAERKGTKKLPQDPACHHQPEGKQRTWLKPITKVNYENRN